jgi:hypothetical protein
MAVESAKKALDFVKKAEGRLAWFMVVDPLQQLVRRRPTQLTAVSSVHLQLCTCCFLVVILSVLLSLSFFSSSVYMLRRSVRPIEQVLLQLHLWSVI